MRAKATLPQKNAEIRRLRTRMREAETKAIQARAESDAAIANAHAEIERERAYAQRVTEQARAERQASADYLNSPAWERDLLILARDRVREELITLSLTHKSCETCGSFGRGFQQGFLEDAIEQLTEAHNLPPAPKLPDPDWPMRMGANVRKGKLLDRQWHAVPATGRKPKAHRMF